MYLTYTLRHVYEDYTVEVQRKDILAIWDTIFVWSEEFLVEYRNVTELPIS